MKRRNETLERPLDAMRSQARQKSTRRTGERTREMILRAATAEFAAHGLAGARISRIVRKAQSNPRMIYEHFGSKSELYVAALETALAELRSEELTLDVEHLDPLEGLLKLFEFMNDHFEKNGHLVSLLRAENLTKARYIKKSTRLKEMSAPVVSLTARMIARGVAEGTLAGGIDPLRLYLMMAALSQFHLTNVHTLSVIFDPDIASPEWRALRRADAKRMLTAYLVRKTG